MVCQECRREFTEDEGRLDSDGEFYCTDCYNEQFSTCSYCSNEVYCEEAFYDEGYVCNSCCTEHYRACGCCGELTHHESLHESVDGRICGSCHTDRYHDCGCGATVHNDDWCYDCETCGGCCNCGCEESEEPVPEQCNPYPDPDSYAGQSVPLNSYNDRLSRAVPPSPYNYDSPVRSQPSLGGSSTGMPALIQRLDNSAFTLNDTNIKTVLGMLDKSKKLKVGDITGRHCTANDSYFQLSRIVAEVGKVKKPMYFYGVRSNEYDVVLNHSTRAIVDKLNSLGLTYHVGTGDRTKVGLSFKVRKRKYDMCITFLKFLCTK